MSQMKFVIEVNDVEAVRLPEARQSIGEWLGENLAEYLFNRKVPDETVEINIVDDTGIGERVIISLQVIGQDAIDMMEYEHDN